MATLINPQQVGRAIAWAVKTKYPEMPAHERTLQAISYGLDIVDDWDDIHQVRAGIYRFDGETI